MKIICTLLLALFMLASCDRPSPAPSPPTLTLFAAASTTDALTEAVKLFESTSTTRITANFAASSTLAQQIKAGAAADLFISADEKWMDELAISNLLIPGSRSDLLGNDLVLVAPKDKPFTVRMAKDFDFAASLPDIKRLAIADSAHVPAGRYAQQSLEHLGWWPALKDKLLPAQDVRAALRLVELGEADAGIVYSTDAAASTKVALIASFPSESHEPIAYPIALIKHEGSGSGGASNATAAQAFLDFLHSPQAAAIFTKHGFRVPSRP